MAEWRVGGKLKRTLYRDEQLVGLVDTAEIAGEIVETMNRVGRLLDEVRRHNEDTGFRDFLRGEQLSRVDPYDSTKGGVTAPCGCDPASGTECRRHMTMITDGSRRLSGRERSPDEPPDWEHWHGSAGLVE